MFTFENDANLLEDLQENFVFFGKDEEIRLEEAKSDFKLLIENCEDEEDLEEGFKEFKEKLKSKFKKKSKNEGKCEDDDCEEEDEEDESDDKKADKCDSLSEAYNMLLSEANVIKYGKETLKKRLLSRSTLIMAKEAGDPLYDKWKLHAEKKAAYRKEITRKYEGKAKKKVKEYLAARKAKSKA